MSDSVDYNNLQIADMVRYFKSGGNVCRELDRDEPVLVSIWEDELSRKLFELYMPVGLIDYICHSMFNPNNDSFFMRSFPNSDINPQDHHMDSVDCGSRMYIKSWNGQWSSMGVDIFSRMGLGGIDALLHGAVFNDYVLRDANGVVVYMDHEQTDCIDQFDYIRRVNARNEKTDMLLGILGSALVIECFVVVLLLSPPIARNSFRGVKVLANGTCQAFNLLRALHHDLPDQLDVVESTPVEEGVTLSECYEFVGEGIKDTCKAAAKDIGTVANAVVPTTISSGTTAVFEQMKEDAKTVGGILSSIVSGAIGLFKNEKFEELPNADKECTEKDPIRKLTEMGMC